MKIKFFSFGRSAVLFTLAVLLAFVFNACAGGAGSAIDDFTADGDYYNDGSSGSGVPININIPTGLGWVSNGSASYNAKANVGANGITDSSLTPEQAVQVNQARVLAQQAGSNNSSYSAALNILENVLKDDPNAQEAAELYNAIKRFRELEGIGCESLIAKKEAELAKLEKEIAELESKIESQKTKVQQALEAMNKALEEYNEIADKYAKKTLELEIKNAEINSCRKKLADLQGQLDNETDPVKKAQLQKEYDDLNKEYEKLLLEQQSLKDELDLLERQLAAAKEKYETAKKNYEKQVEILEEYIAQYNAKCSLRDELIQLIKDLKAERETLRTYLKNIDYVSTGLKDYTYSMRWIVDPNTSPYEAYKDITRFIYERYEKGYGEDCTYALVGSVDGVLYDENNYITMSIEYDKNYDTRSYFSPYYGEYFVGAAMNKSVYHSESGPFGSSEHEETTYDYYNGSYSWGPAAYYDNIGTDSKIKPQAVISTSSSVVTVMGNYASTPYTLRLPYSYDVISGKFTFSGNSQSVSVGAGFYRDWGDLFSYPVAQQFSTKYTKANIKITFKDQYGNEIPELSKYQYVEHAQLNFSGTAGTPFDVYKARTTYAHLRDEAKNMPFPVMDVTLFGRSDQVKVVQQ